MERLTKRDRGGNARMDCGKCEIQYREGCCSTKLCKNALIDRLAAYEDAEEQGLLARLPVKSGDTVYQQFTLQESYVTPDCTGKVYWIPVVEDVKGTNATKTAQYKVKKKMLAERFGLFITEV